jgi:GT2 family glycosyltransferase
MNEFAPFDRDVGASNGAARVPHTDESDVLPVYVIHWNAPEWCDSSVRSLLTTREARIALTVIDNGQDHGAPVRDLLPSGVRVVTAGTNRGYTGGANLAIDDWRRHHPGAPFAVVAAHDLHVEPDTLTGLLTIARSHHEYGIVAPSVLGQYACGGVWDGRDVRPASPERVERAGDVLRPDWAPGVCLLLRRECIDAIGGFDEWFGSYVEDLDLCLRARDAGWVVGLVPTARARSLGSASPASFQLIETNLIRLQRKRGGRAAGLRAAATVAHRFAHCVVGSVLPWRSRERREVSRSYARRRARSLRAALPSVVGSRRPGP